MEVEKVVRSNGESATVKLDRMMSNKLNEITTTANKELLPHGLEKPFHRNCLSLMTATGAKGGMVSFSLVRTYTALLIYLVSRLRPTWSHFICLDRST